MSKTADEKKDARLNSGVGAGVFGLCSNAVLFALKTAAGVLSGSITVVADAVNNLSDAGGSALTLAGFRLAARPADREHPFGHARYEYITTLVLSLLVFAVGAVLCYTSVSAVIDPEPLTASAFSYAVLDLLPVCPYFFRDPELLIHRFCFCCVHFISLSSFIS